MAGSHASTPTEINTPIILKIGGPLKLCKDCKHARSGGEEWSDSNASCWRATQTSYVTGEEISLRWCISERHNFATCGPDAKFFEERV